MTQSQVLERYTVSLLVEVWIVLLGVVEDEEVDGHILLLLLLMNVNLNWKRMDVVDLAVVVMIENDEAFRYRHCFTLLTLESVLTSHKNTQSKIKIEEESTL